MDRGVLAGRTALVTGVSRRRGIGHAIALELARHGASVVAHHHAPHDADQPWGADDLDAVAEEIRAELTPGAELATVAGDLREPDRVDALVRAAEGLPGRFDVCVCNHARSGGDGSILDVDAAALDAFWETNTRSTLLLTRRFAESLGHRAQGARPGDRASSSAVDPASAPKVVWMTSGQQEGPMRGEVAYAASKAALAGVTATVAAELADLGIVLNTVNPGPVNTGYLDADGTDRELAGLDDLLARTPFGRWGRPEDAARTVRWLVSPDGSWVVGRVLTSDGGFGLV